MLVTTTMPPYSLAFFLSVGFPPAASVPTAASSGTALRSTGGGRSGVVRISRNRRYYRASCCYTTATSGVVITAAAAAITSCSKGWVCGIWWLHGATVCTSSSPSRWWSSDYCELWAPLAAAVFTNEHCTTNWLGGRPCTAMTY